jgi:hypothetical protein
VDSYKVDKPAKADTFKKVHDFLVHMRDGRDTPDVFYLGHLPGKKGRYGCRLDAIFTVGLPPSGPERDAFVRQHRIGTLSTAFARDLHVRLFVAFASLGFDDHQWFSDEDLVWLVAKGREDLSRTEQELRSAQRARAEAEASGKQFSQKDLTQKMEVMKKIQRDLRPFEDEAERRGLSTE